VNITEEQLKQWEEEIDREANFLREHGWKEVTAPFSPPWNGEGLGWEDPFGTVHPYSNGYTQLVLQLLRERGWRMVKEIRHYDNEGRLIERMSEWGRYQSPVTKRIYTYLDAQYVLEQGSDESGYPERYCGATVELDRLVGDNFTGDVIETWFHKVGENSVLEMWTSQ
jgi:hypothetical protein